MAHKSTKSGYFVLVSSSVVNTLTPIHIKLNMHQRLTHRRHKYGSLRRETRGENFMALDLDMSPIYYGRSISDGAITK